MQKVSRIKFHHLSVYASLKLICTKTNRVDLDINFSVAWTRSLSKKNYNGINTMRKKMILKPFDVCVKKYAFIEWI